MRVELSEDGELIHSGAGTMLGYLDSPDFGETTRVPTGDLFARGPDGAYRYLGRRDDMIKINGNRIYPREIELELARHPAVADCTVLPLGQDIDLSAGPGSDGGVPRLAAFVVPRQGAEVTGAELQAHCRSRLEGWAVPDRFVLLAELPRTESHKPDRTALRALL